MVQGLVPPAVGAEDEAGHDRRPDALPRERIAACLAENPLVVWKGPAAQLSLVEQVSIGSLLFEGHVRVGRALAPSVDPPPQGVETHSVSLQQARRRLAPNHEVIAVEPLPVESNWPVRAGGCLAFPLPAVLLEGEVPELVDPAAHGQELAG